MRRTPNTHWTSTKVIRLLTTKLGKREKKRDMETRGGRDEEGVKMDQKSVGKALQETHKVKR